MSVTDASYCGDVPLHHRHHHHQCHLDRGLPRPSARRRRAQANDSSVARRRKLLDAIRVGVFLTVVIALGSVPVPVASAEATSQPVPGRIVAGFNPPDQPWLAGHRGVDILAPPGSRVVAPRPGTVTFAGMVAGKPVVVITHGATRTTLEPVRASVGVGTGVAAGDVVGVLVPGHACPGGQCLHWGLKDDDQYLDPTLGVTLAEVRLLPESAERTARQRAAERDRVEMLAAAEASAYSGPVTAIGGGVLGVPVAGRRGSPFGPRFHPIFHEWRLHAGIDISAPCGTPIRAAADGVVQSAGFDSSGGWRLVVAHAPVSGRSLVTQYLHAQGYRVRSGQRVVRGEVVGWVGSTGWSTGCHLHFGVKVDGRHVDPARLMG